VSELQDQVPTFSTSHPTTKDQPALTNWSALTSPQVAANLREVLLIVGFGVLIIGGTEVLVRALQVPEVIFVPPSTIFVTLVTNFVPVFLPYLLTTLEELAIGLAIGATIGLILAAVITQRPIVEKIVTPYIILLVTTPMLALVPLLQLKLGYGITPKVIAVTLASGPMVMINSATGFRRTDLAKIALARSYGASTLQVFRHIRFPLALPMIIVGFMVGSIFGLLTAVGAEIVGGDSGLGSRLTFYSSYINMPMFFATILLLALLGISIYVIFFFVGKRWASWES
jgi:NitT/TauT family transport system permease protein